MGPKEQFMKMTIMLLACACGLGGWATVLRADATTAQVKMEVMAEGAMRKLGGYMPQQLKLVALKPASLKKGPDSKSALYGAIQFGGAKHIVVLDEPEGADSKLYVDVNGNGDVTDDPSPTWEKKEYPGPGGKTFTQYTGAFKLPLGKDEKAPLVTLATYRFDSNDPQRAQFKNTLFYYRDYALDGEVTLGEKKYHAMLVDDKAGGDFSAKGPAAPRLMIDRNSDGKFDYRSESFDVAKAFNIDGTVWKVADLTVDGNFKLATSTEQVAEIKPPADLSVGKIITPFKAQKMDGKPVNFPADYKGKVVMLDFWATWCGPCMSEVPGLAKAYAEYHPKGVEILGISLDQPNSAPKIKQVTGENNMTWPQVYDGKFWQAEIAQLYNINSIPAAFLVDGDTGEILAAGNSLRGPGLEETFKAALEKKGKK
jgi:thiol-disulfide isomerase/thioredoxin